MSTEKALTLRLPLALADDLEVVAAVDHCTQADVIRQAIAAHIETRRADPEFRARTDVMVARLSSLIGSRGERDGE